MRRLAHSVLVLLLAWPASASAQDPIPEIRIDVTIERAGHEVAPAIRWVFPSTIEKKPPGLYVRVDRGPGADGPWEEIANVVGSAGRWQGAPVAADARAELERSWYRVRVFDTGAPGVAPTQHAESVGVWAGGPRRTRASIAAEAAAPATAPPTTPPPARSVKAPSGGPELAVTSPRDGDGLNLDLEWTAAGEAPAAWGVVRRVSPAGDWTVLTVGLPSGTTEFSDKVTSDPRTSPPAAAYDYRVVALRALVPEDADVAALLAAGTASAAVTGETDPSWIRTQLGSLMLMFIIVAVGFLMWWFTALARRGEEIYIRRIPGIDAIEEGIGRATEMGKPVLYVPGIDELQDIQTIASMLILGQVGKMVAEYQSDIIVSCCIPIVREVADEVVRAGFYQAGHPDAYRPQNTRFISSEQFAFCAGTNGIIYREKPATNIYLGRFFAESLILAETGFVNKSIQIAGTAEATQLPFFIAACDYTLIGEELFAVSAYLSKDPRLISSLKASDWTKVLCVVAIVLGTLENTLTGGGFIQSLFTIVAG